MVLRGLVVAFFIASNSKLVFAEPTLAQTAKVTLGRKNRTWTHKLKLFFSEVLQGNLNGPKKTEISRHLQYELLENNQLGRIFFRKLKALAQDEAYGNKPLTDFSCPGLQDRFLEETDPTIVTLYRTLFSSYNALGTPCPIPTESLIVPEKCRYNYFTPLTSPPRWANF
jgi:hypothetical protein